MDLAMWLNKPSITMGHMEDIRWELAEVGISVPDRARDFGAILRASGWNRYVTSKGRIWCAPGIVHTRVRGDAMVSIAVALREILSSHGEMTVAELRAAVASRCCKMDRPVFAKALERQVMKGRISIDGPDGSRIAKWIPD